MLHVLRQFNRGRMSRVQFSVWSARGLFLHCWFGLVLLLQSEGIGLAAARLSVELIDVQSKEAVPGWFRILDADGQPIELPDQYSRGLGLHAGHPAHRWYAVRTKEQVMLPKAEIYVEAFSGLNSELARQKLDLRFFDRLSIKLPIRELWPLRSRGWFSGNTHLHLKGIEREDADYYLATVPSLDRLDLVFVSRLERAVEDRTYVSNEYSRTELKALRARKLLIGDGQEHRHNFGAWGEGYGHVMFLGLPRRVEPVSIGPGISGGGYDYPSLQQGIDAARGMGGFVIWCHNQYGIEDIPNWLSGGIDAQNIFDGGSRGLFLDTFYRYLNVGLSVPFSTGTDWFMDDFSRVYVQVPDSLTMNSWLSGLGAGRSFISNGPLLEFEVEGTAIGGRLDLTEDQVLAVKARAIGRHDFGELEIILNGRKVEAGPAKSVGRIFETTIESEVMITEGSWLAARVSGGGTVADGNLVVPASTPRRGSGANVNEMREALFAHTSPVYVSMNGRLRFEPEVAEELIAEMELAQSLIREKGKFESAQQLNELLEVYDEAMVNLRDRIVARGKTLP